MKTELMAIGKLLQGKEADFHYGQLARILDDEIASIRAKLRNGLPRDAYELATAKLHALHTSKMVIKSIQIYNAE